MTQINHIKNNDANSYIKAPIEIRFECSSCSNCCLQWPVPITEEDYKRISTYSFNSNYIRPLRSKQTKFQMFTHTLEKREDGKCEFLLENNKCKLHAELGQMAKPSMCILYPYTFTITPTAILAGLSFSSSAVLLNTGSLLSEQEKLLKDQYNIFCQLFNPNPKIWENLQLIDGQALTWSQFNELDLKLMSLVENLFTTKEISQKIKLKTLFSKLFEISESILEIKNFSSKEPKLETRPKLIDQIILKYLNILYFPKEIFNHQEYDLAGRSLMTELVNAPLQINFEELKYSELIEYKLGELPSEIEYLLERFFYMRLFSKMYFGPGFHHLSLIAGLAHLNFLYHLIRLKIKATLITHQHNHLDIYWVSELIRSLDRRLSQLDLSPESIAILEVLLINKDRNSRLSWLTN